MFVYQRKINEKDGIIFVGESVDQGRHLPVINGPVYAVYETEDGKIVAKAGEMVDGELEGSNLGCFYYVDQVTNGEEETETLIQLPKKYTVKYYQDNPNETDPAAYFEFFCHVSEKNVYDEETGISEWIGGPFMKEELQVIATTSAGQTLPIVLQNTSTEEEEALYSIVMDWDSLQEGLQCDKFKDGWDYTTVTLSASDGSQYTLDVGGPSTPFYKIVYDNDTTEFEELPNGFISAIPISNNNILVNEYGDGSQAQTIASYPVLLSNECMVGAKSSSGYWLNTSINEGTTPDDKKYFYIGVSGDEMHEEDFYDKTIIVDGEECQATDITLYTDTKRCTVTRYQTK